MEIEIGENKKCEHCGKVIEYDDLKMCLTCKSKQVHEEVTQFLKKLQEAQEATRKHNTHFGPGPNGSYDCNINN